MNIQLWLLTVALPLIHCHHQYESTKVLLNGNYNMSWTTTGDSVNFRVRARTTGWVGLGFSANNKGDMMGGDMIIGWVKAGAVTVKDAFAPRKDTPEVDARQDVFNISGSELHGITELTYSRNITVTACDADDSPLRPGSSRIIFAFGNEDPAGSWLDSGDWHGYNRGSATVFLLSSRPVAPPHPSDTDKIDLRVSGTGVIPAYPGGGPSESPGTTYWCKTFELPVDRKYHAIQVDPLIQAGNVGKVHHILLFDCPSHPSGDGLYENYCFHNDSGVMPASVLSCRGGSMIAGWGIGADGQIYPKEAGLPIGLGSVQHVLMEV